MTKALPFLLLAALTLNSLAFADTESDMNGSGPPPTMGRSGRGSRGKRLNPDNSGKTAGNIRGVCSVLQSANNPLPGPCVNTLLILNDSNGNEVVKARTTTQGQFEFVAETGKDYKIASGSRYYDIVSPTAKVHGGDKVDLRLQQK